MSYSISVSELNPIRFHRADANKGKFWYNTKPRFEYDRGYCQPYQHFDSVYLQFRCEGFVFGNLKMQIIDSNGNHIWPTIPFPYYTLTAAYSVFGRRCFEFNNQLPALPEGIYYLKLSATHYVDGFAVNYIFLSEPIHLAASHKDTIAVAYRNFQNDYDFGFLSGTIAVFPTPMLRIHGGLKSDGIQPGGKYDMYTDMDYRQAMLRSEVYTVEKWTFGGAHGLPPYMAQKLNAIWSLTDVWIDGKKYVRHEGAKMERSGEDAYPLAAWTLDVVKPDNPHSTFDALTIEDSDIDSSSTNITIDNEYITSDMI